MKQEPVILRISINELVDPISESGNVFDNWRRALGQQGLSVSAILFTPRNQRLCKKKKIIKNNIKENRNILKSSYLLWLTILIGIEIP